ncbi:hypothetical protein CCHR01_00502 [Colletotrichum chrysophilum]|uniref:Uncharacterized protein n=1 Tax=Colletotrichum chrysophilum TaxID=1836956 RepID=A0AAD9B105_9PEZI|nr:hypothetical protein CCHR01_00502 [Colletotrichum chrysophilum]
MRHISHLLLVVAAVTTASPLTPSPENVSLAPRSELFARKLCLIEDGMSCYYDGGACYYHDCTQCKCDANWLGQKLTRRNCALYTDCPYR